MLEFIYISWYNLYMNSTDKNLAPNPNQRDLFQELVVDSEPNGKEVAAAHDRLQAIVESTAMLATGITLEPAD